MKLQRAQETEERNPYAAMIKQVGASTAVGTPARQVRPSFDDLHAHIATRAYELYAQRGFREGCAKEDWLDAEREIVSRGFPVSSDLRRGDSL